MRYEQSKRLGASCFDPRPHNCATTSEDTEDSGARTGQTNLASDSQMEDGISASVSWRPHSAESRSERTEQTMNVELEAV